MLCRLCVHEVNKESFVTLYRNGEDSNLIKLITKYLHIEVSKNDSFSDIICNDCNRALNSFHDFFHYIEQRQQEMQNEFFKVNFIVSDNATKEAPNYSEHNEMESVLDIKDIIETDKSDESMPNIEFGFADDCDKLDDSDSEMSEVVKPYPNKKDKIKAKRKSKNFNRKALRCSSRLLTAKHKENVPSLESTCSEIEKISKSITDMPIKSYSNVENPKKQTCNSAAPKDSARKNDIIAEYMQLKCDICQEVANDMAALRLHFRQEHNRKAYVTCCGRHFHRRFLLVDHIQVHLNPEHFKCNICSKVFKTRINLEMHNANMHIEKNELKYPCEFCDRRFAHTTNLIAHLTSHTKERNYRCELCNKAFKSGNVLKVHMRSIHEKITLHICDICGKEYKSKPSFDRHTAEHQGQSISVPKKQCKICGKSFSVFYFSRHKRLHETVNTNCEKCGKSFKSKATLNYHMVNSHHGKRNYSCTICDKTFLRPEYLKEHINRHTGEKIYSCKYCLRGFRSKSSMYGHVKRSHFEQWKQAKLIQNQDFNKSTDVTNDLSLLKA